MYKTLTIKNVKDLSKRASIVSEVINEQEKEGWDFHSGISAHKYSIILVFKKNPTHKLNEDINKGLTKVKDKVSKVVDAIKS